MTKQDTARRVTLQDIARKTGFSVNTVSHALRNKQDISEETREYIKETAKELGYTGNQIARSLRSGRTHSIALILGNMSNPFYGSIADCLQDAAQVKGYTLTILCSRDEPELEQRMVEEAIARCADGVFLIPSKGSELSIARLQEAKIPFVLLFRATEQSVADCIVCDDENGAYLATRHLIESGKRKLAYIANNDILYSSKLRQQGFLRACDEAGLPAEARSIHIAARDFLSEREDNAWREEMTALLLSLKRDGYDGIFSFCDMEAWQLMDIIGKCPELTPNPFGIVSFDNLADVLSFPLPLCSISYPFKDIAKRGVKLLRSRIHGDTTPPQTIVTPVELICRESCRPI